MFSYSTTSQMTTSWSPHGMGSETARSRMRHAASACRRVHRAMERVRSVAFVLQRAGFHVRLCGLASGGMLMKAK